MITGAGAAINSAGLRPGETAVVIGVGGVGLNVIAGARLAGADRIIAIDTQASKEELARKFGATDFINGKEVDPIEAVKAILPYGADHVFEVIGLQATTEQATQMVRRGGSVFLIGLHRPGTTFDVAGLDMIVRQVDVRGVFMGSSNIKHDIPMFADLYLQGRFNLDDLVAREVNISDINEAYDDLKHGAIARTVITSF